MNYQQTVEAVNAVIAEYAMPLTLRQIYYRLVAAGLIPNRRSAYNGLSAQLVKAREVGDVDEYRIVDRSRTVNDISFDSPQDYLEAAIYTLKAKYLRRFWTSQEAYVEVWVEKDALSAVLAGAVKDYNTIVAPSRGYSSYSYLKSAVGRMYNNHPDASKVIVLHFADHDPSGLDMTRDLQDRFDNYAIGDVEVKRISLTYEQVQEHNLIPNPTKFTDTRSGGYMARYGDECWELDAIEPDKLVDMVNEAVEAEIDDWDAWEELKEQDTNERKELRELFDKLKKDYEEGK
jgi:hypothetical protein